MFIGPLLNASGLFQTLGGLQRRVNEGDHDLEFFVDKFLYRATSVLLSLDQMRALERACLDQVKRAEPQLHLHGTLTIWSIPLVEMLTLIPPTFASLRQMQNQFLPMAGRAAGIRHHANIPRSMHDAVKILHKIDFSEEFKRIIGLYWHGSGVLLKEYRDVDQHYDVLVDRVIYIPGSNHRLPVILPDNPREKSAKRFTFEQRPL
jgi:hypothetical protein